MSTTDPSTDLAVAEPASPPRVVLVARPEMDCTDLYVVRHTAAGREAFSVPYGDDEPRWQQVPAGCEPPRLARLTDAVGIDLYELDALIDTVKQHLAAVVAP